MYYLSRTFIRPVDSGIVLTADPTKLYYMHVGMLYMIKITRQANFIIPRRLHH